MLETNYILLDSTRLVLLAVCPLKTRLLFDYLLNRVIIE